MKNEIDILTKLMSLVPTGYVYEISMIFYINLFCLPYITIIYISVTVSIEINAVGS